jgi:YegS/Rv2252/BmrU family lipid kinase
VKNVQTVTLLYNPYSGNGKFENEVEGCVESFANAGKTTKVVSITTIEEMEEEILALPPENELVVCGGDGTVNLAINIMKQHKKNNPLGIIPAGTANDFASFLGLPKKPSDAACAIANGNVISADLGVANGKYFINVCGGGLFINISHSVSSGSIAKNLFGKLAYYIKGIGEVAKNTPFRLKITTPTEVFDDDFALFIALNSSGCGGFHSVSPEAKIDDGLLDFVAFKYMPTMEIAGIFLKILSGNHLSDNRVIFFREKEIKIEQFCETHVETDVDGEIGPDMPLNISCEKGAIQLIVPRRYSA